MVTLPRLASLPVTELKGVGPKHAADLAAKEIHSVLDLLTHYPRRWVDRTNEARIGDLVPEQNGLVIATVQRVSTRRARTGKMLVEVQVTDGTGFLTVTFFNQTWRAKQLKPGTTGAFFGKVTLYRTKRQMTNPLVDLVGTRGAEWCRSTRSRPTSRPRRSALGWPRPCGGRATSKTPFPTQ